MNVQETHLQGMMFPDDIGFLGLENIVQALMLARLYMDSLPEKRKIIENGLPMPIRNCLQKIVSLIKYSKNPIPKLFSVHWELKKNSKS